METQYLKTLLAVFELNSFSKAADSLFITQSAVSQRVKYLEEFYGFRLLDKSGKLQKPTAAGRIIKKKAEQILVLEKEMVNELKGLLNKKGFSLCSTPTFGIAYLPKVLNRYFLANTGDVDFKFSMNTPEQSLKGLFSNEYDLAIIEHCGDFETGTAVIYTLPPDELLFVSSPSLGLSSSGTSLDELMAQRLIARREGCSSRCLLQENLSHIGRTIDDFGSMIIYDDIHMNIQSVLEGQGVAFISRSLVYDYLQRNELQEHTISGFHCFRSRSIVLPGIHADNPIIQSFLESVFSVFNIPFPIEREKPRPKEVGFC